MAFELPDTLKQIFADVVTSGSVIDTMQTNAVALVIQNLTGEQPVINVYPDHAEIILNQAQVKKLQTFLDHQISGKVKEDRIQLDLSPVIVPVLLKKAVPLLLLAFALGWILKRR
jgi:hypothetical protein